MDGTARLCRASIVKITTVGISLTALISAAGFWMPRAGVLLALLGLSVGAVLLVCGAATAHPRTMYKLRDIENAKQNLERHEWAQDIVKGWERGASFALEQDRAYFEALIPELTPGTSYGQNCPQCVGKQSLMGQARFGWRPEAPEQITCNACGAIYPDEAYPETGTVECPRMGQTFTYYETPEERANPDARADHALKWLGDRPTMTSFSGLIRFQKIGWAYGQSLLLAKLYAVTGDVAYAERVVWILDRIAQVYPGYLFHSYDGSIADWPPAEVAANMGEQERADGPRGGRFPPDAVRHAYGLNRYDDYSTLHNGFWGAGRMACHGKGSDSGPLTSMTIAFDLVRDAQYPDGSRLVDGDVGRRIVDDLILAGCRDMEHWNSLSNKGTAVFVLCAAVGSLLEQPDRVRYALDGFERMLADRYHFDGFYSESPAYAEHNLSNTRELPDLLNGYSDPVGYEPDEGQRIDELDPFRTGHYPMALTAMIRMLGPGHRLPVIGDTRYDTKTSVLCTEVLADRLDPDYAGLLETVQESNLEEEGSEYALWYRPADLRSDGPDALPLRSEWFPGWHVGVLRGGRDENDTAVYLNGNENQWTTHTGHRQRDVLSLSSYAYGEELARDLGYYSGSGHMLPDGRRGQDWARSTLSHNLVVVDEDDQEARDCGSNLELFGISPGIEVIQASGFNVYPQCDEYRRTTALIRRPDGQTYTVDLFRVKGGKVHQYGMSCNGTLAAVEGAQPAELSPAWGRWLSNPVAVEPGGPLTVTWTFRDVSLDVALLNAADRIIAADSPGWRVANREELERSPIQQVLSENRSATSSETLTSQFAAVMVPYREEGSPITSARLLETDAASGVLAVEVKLEGRTDIIVSTMDQEERQYGAVTVAGQFAFVSVDDEGHAIQGYLLNGSRLACGDLEIVLPEPAATLKVRGTEDRIFHLAEPLAADAATVGSYVLAGRDPQTGFEVESTSGDAITVRDYPAIACDEVTILNSGWVER